MRLHTNVRSSSHESYASLRGEGQLANQEEAILHVIKPSWNYSLKELSNLTGIAINAVSGRVNGLKKKGRLVECDRRPCSLTGRKIIPVMIPSRIPQFDY